jgi:hypothetical protein
MIRHQWLLIVVITAGLIGMHHLVHVHTGHAGHSHPASIEGGPVAVMSTAVSHADCCDPMDMVGHLCLAVLTAITVMVAVVLAAMWRRTLKLRSVLATVSAVAARAPPIGRPRLTQLCVLRC